MQAFVPRKRTGPRKEYNASCMHLTGDCTSSTSGDKQGLTVPCASVHFYMVKMRIITRTSNMARFTVPLAMRCSVSSRLSHLSPGIFSSSSALSEAMSTGAFPPRSAAPRGNAFPGRGESSGACGCFGAAFGPDERRLFCANQCSPPQISYHAGKNSTPEKAKGRP